MKRKIEDCPPVVVRRAVFEALGQVSMCWSVTPKGVFKDREAVKIGNKLTKEILLMIERAYAGGFLTGQAMYSIKSKGNKKENLTPVKKVKVRKERKK